VLTLPVWIDDWVYECCGQVRRLGEAVELDLTFGGDIRAATGPDSTDVLDDGQVVIVGSVLGPVADEGNHTAGTLIACGAVQFAIRGDAPAPHVQCSGRLDEVQHGYPTGRTRGQLAGIRWRPAIVRPVGDGGGVIEGYGPGEELTSTDDWRERLDEYDSRSWALQLAVNVADGQ
jgi:hypothetical protein